MDICSHYHSQEKNVFDSIKRFSVSTYKMAKVGITADHVTSKGFFIWDSYINLACCYAYAESMLANHISELLFFFYNNQFMLSRFDQFILLQSQIGGVTRFHEAIFLAKKTCFFFCTTKLFKLFIHFPLCSMFNYVSFTFECTVCKEIIYMPFMLKNVSPEIWFFGKHI